MMADHPPPDNSSSSDMSLDSIPAPLSLFRSSSVSEDLKCIICLEIARDAVESPCCHKLFCYECGKRLTKCPLRCGDLNPPYPTTNIVIQRLIESMRYPCRYANNGCPDIIGIHDLDQHEEECVYQIIPCPFGGECSSLMKKDLENHSDICPFAVTDCPTCSSKVLIKKLSQLGLNHSSSLLPSSSPHSSSLNHMDIENGDSTQSGIPMRINEKVKRLETMLEWLRENGAKWKCDRATSIPDMRRSDWLDLGGLRYPNAVKAGEVVLEIPLSCTIHLTLAKQGNIFQKLFDGGVKLSSEHTPLALYLLEERNNPHSKFRCYIDTLRSSSEYERVTPAFYSDREKEYLKGSYTLTKLETQRLNVEKEYNNIITAVPSISEQFSFTDFFWARLIVLTRVFGMSNKSATQRSMALCPLLDSLRHYHQRNAKWEYSDEKNSFIVTALTDADAGTPIKISFGEKSNTRWLVNYGFIQKNNELFDTAAFRLPMQWFLSAFDRMDLSISDDDRRLFLQAINDSSDTMPSDNGIIILSSIDYEVIPSRLLLSILRILANRKNIPYPSIKNIQSNTIHQLDAISIENEIDTLDMLAQTAQNGLSEFSTNIDYDDAELKSIHREKEKLLTTIASMDTSSSSSLLSSSSELLSKHHQLIALGKREKCIEIRMCEKRVYHYYYDLAEFFRNILSAALEKGDEKLSALKESLKKVIELQSGSRHVDRKIMNYSIYAHYLNNHLCANVADDHTQERKKRKTETGAVSENSSQTTSSSTATNSSESDDASSNAADMIQIRLMQAFMRAMMTGSSHSH